MPPSPWHRRQREKDGEEFPVIRDAKSCPVAYVDKGLHPEIQDRVVGLIVAGPDMLEALREVMMASETAVPWSKWDWQKWRNRHGTAIAIAMGMIE